MPKRERIDMHRNVQKWNRSRSRLLRTLAGGQGHTGQGDQHLGVAHGCDSNGERVLLLLG